MANYSNDNTVRINIKRLEYAIKHKFRSQNKFADEIAIRTVEEPKGKSYQNDAVYISNLKKKPFMEKGKFLLYCQVLDVSINYLNGTETIFMIDKKNNYESNDFWINLNFDYYKKTYSNNQKHLVEDFERDYCEEHNVWIDDDRCIVKSYVQGLEERKNKDNDKIYVSIFHEFYRELAHTGFGIENSIDLLLSKKSEMRSLMYAIQDLIIEKKDGWCNNSNSEDLPF